MWQILTLLVFTPAICAKEEGITIPIYRQKSPRELAINHHEHSKYFPAHWMKPTAGPTNDSIALYRYMDTEFYAVIQIGKKARPFNLALDTAWADTWVLSEECPYKNIGCWFHNKYDHTQSSTYVENGTQAVISVGSYNLTGFYSEDVIYLEQLNVTNQTFVEITEVPYYYILSKLDGVLGLGYSSLSQGGVTPVFYNLIKQKRIKKPLFSIYMNRDRSSNRGGVVILGRIEDRHILKNQTITYMPVIQTGYWQFKVDSIALDTGKTEFPFCINGCEAIVDTSTSAIVGPILEIRKINRLLRAKYLMLKKYYIDCETINKLPEISFMIGGKNFTLHGRDYVQQISYKSFTLCLSAFTEPETDKQKVWILGAAFLAEFYTIYDMEHNQIGFVKAA